MSLLPRGLFARTFLLVGGLLLVSHSAAIALFFVNFAWPAAERGASAVADHWQSVQAALQVLPPESHARFREELGARGVWVRAEIDPAELTVKPTVFQASLIRHLRRRLGADLPIRITTHTPARLWLPVTAGRERLWVGFVQRTPDRPLSSNLFRQSFVMALLALLAAWWVARLINRPLAHLASAAAEIGRGQTPALLAERGPQEVRLLHRAFNQMAHDVQQAAEDRRLLLAGVSHDLRTPLARLRLALEMSGERIDSGLATGMIQDVEEIDHIIGQFSLYVREGADERFEPCDLNALLRQIAERYAQQGQQLKLALSDLPQLDIKPVALRRALTNLIENAWRHGGGEVEVRTSLEAHQALVAVCDRGPGVRPEEIARLERPFTPVGSDAEGGLHGLGLAIVSRVARLHRGALSLLPRPGGGLEARLVLPLGRSGAGPAPAGLRK